ncbi:PAS domain-containing protein [Rhodococcus globerulus]|uniref:histidine kinase n=1 Tax=Rhodococcus globerulus TaxID=33008 RepID=A0ABU4C576_RHOGO|nr:PAS domain-containing protein [Rhodococcus globerulus]MDV6271663.1 PAS domain-containing protein [Rhodococcus globerulus]
MSSSRHLLAEHSLSVSGQNTDYETVPAHPRWVEDERAWAAMHSRMGQVSESGAPHRVGGFRYSREGDEWEWSDNVAKMHGYPPGEVVPTTELLLSHKHPDDRRDVAQTLNAIRTSGGPFSSRHRIVDTQGVTRSVIVVGDSIVDESGTVTGSSGFYIDVTETLDRTVKESVDEVVDAINSSRGAIEQAKGMLMIECVCLPGCRELRWSEQGRSWSTRGRSRVQGIASGRNAWWTNRIAR